MKRLLAPRALTVGTVAFALALAVSACSASNENSGSNSGGNGNVSGTLNGAGSTAQQAAMTAWQAAFQTSNSGVTVNYDAVGSGGGRDEWLGGQVQFAGSDAYLTDDEVKSAKSMCGSDPIEVPVYVSPIAVVYNLPGVTSLKLSPSVVAQIFAGKITTWNDSAITSLNPGTSLPSTSITPVHRSDDSGTTENFTEYLSAAAASDWTYPPSQTWPLKNGEAGNGTSGVIAAVQAGNGAIGYADASQAGQLGKASIQVGSSYVQPSASAASKVLDESSPVSGRTSGDIAINVNRTPTGSGVYPIILVSYQITCEKQKSAAAANLVKAWLKYVVSEGGQTAAAHAAGSAPITSSLRDKANAAIDSITS